MKVYIVDIDTRKGDGNGSLGPYTTFEKAQKAIVESYGDWVKDYTEFDSDFNKGQIYTEDKTIEIIERELE